MQSFELYSLWLSPRPKDRFVKNHSHNYYELVYYVSGNGKTEIGGKTYRFTKNNFVIIPPNTEHNETHFEDGEVLFIEFSCDRELELCFDKDKTLSVFKPLKELLKEMQTQSFGYKEMFTIKLNELLLKIARNKMGMSDTKSFEYVINYINENYHEHINLADCAALLNLSYDYFQHKFKKITSLSPQQYLIEQRLIAAEKMLRSGTLSCTEVTYRSGFSTSAQFSSLFKKKYGVTPVKYKNSIQK